MCITSQHVQRVKFLAWLLGGHCPLTDCYFVSYSNFVSSYWYFWTTFTYDKVINTYFKNFKCNCVLTSELTVHMLKCIVRKHICCPLIHNSSFIHNSNCNFIFSWFQPEMSRQLCEDVLKKEVGKSLLWEVAANVLVFYLNKDTFTNLLRQFIREMRPKHIFQGKEGCFVVRSSSREGMYTLSVL